MIPEHFDATLRHEDYALLERHLSGYLKLLDGRAPADNEARRRFKKVAAGVAMPLTIHEATFVRWQIAVGWRQPTNPAKREPFLRGQAKQVAAKFAAKGSVAAASVANWAKMPLGSAMASVTAWYNSALATETGIGLDRWLRDNLTGDSSVYDRAVDRVFVETGIGGAYHRYFDGQHDLVGAWNAAAAAAPDDSLIQEIHGYFSALWNDLATPMGLPLATLNKAQFDQFAAQADGFLGISKQWLLDAASATATEIAGATIGALAVCLSWTTEETEEISRLAGSTIVASALAANPILMIIALVCLGRSFHMARHGADLSGLLSGLSQGGAGAAAFVVAASLVSGPVWVTALTGIIACVVAVKVTKDTNERLSQVDWAELARLTVSYFRNPQASSQESRPMLLLPSRM